MNDILDLDKDLQDNIENITMKIKKSRKKYDKQQQIKKRTTKKKYKKQKGGTPMKLGILLITTHGNLYPEELEETYTDIDKMTVRKINATAGGVCNYISPDSLIDMGNSMSTFINSIRKQWEEEYIADSKFYVTSDPKNFAIRAKHWLNVFPEVNLISLQKKGCVS